MIQDRLAGGQKPDISKKSRSKVGQYGGSAFMFKFSFTASSFLSAKKDLPWDLNSMLAVTSGWFTLPALNFLEEKHFLRFALIIVHLLTSGSKGRMQKWIRTGISTQKTNKAMKKFLQCKLHELN
jgi:hypothetical protein